MPIANANRSEVAKKVKAYVKAEGFTSLYAMCREKKVDYQLARRAVNDGLQGRTTLHTVEELGRLGILEIVRASA